jgi:hypothetical protein
MKYIVFAENTTFYSMEVEAKSADEANKIADESDGGDWTEDCSGKWNVREELTHRKE